MRSFPRRVVATGACRTRYSASDVCMAARGMAHAAPPSSSPTSSSPSLAPWASPSSSQKQQQQPSSAEEVFERTFKNSSSHLAAARARAQGKRWEQPHEQQSGDLYNAGTPEPSSSYPFSGVGDDTTVDVVSPVQQIFAKQQHALQKKRTPRAGTVSRANRAAWAGLRRVLATSAESALASTTLGSQLHASPPNGWSAPPYPPPHYPPQPQPHPPSAASAHDAALYRKAYAQWESDNTFIVHTLQESPRIQAEAKKAIQDSRRRSFQEYERKTIRWTLWYVFPMMLIAHIAFFTDATLFGAMVEDIAYVDYAARLKEETPIKVE